MKTHISLFKAELKAGRAIQAALMVGLFALSSSCSTVSERKAGDGDVSANRPMISDAKAEPSKIELGQDLLPRQSTLIFADVDPKDSGSPIQSVHVRFVHVPIDLSMKQMSPTLWAAELTNDQLRQLAVSGQTMTYEANVSAMNDRGQTALSAAPIRLSVEAPSPDQMGGIMGDDSLDQYN